MCYRGSHTDVFYPMNGPEPHNHPSIRHSHGDLCTPETRTTKQLDLVVNQQKSECHQNKVLTEGDRTLWLSNNLIRPAKPQRTHIPKTFSAIAHVESSIPPNVALLSITKLVQRKRYGESYHESSIIKCSTFLYILIPFWLPNPFPKVGGLSNLAPIGVWKRVLTTKWIKHETIKFEIMGYNYRILKYYRKLQSYGRNHTLRSLLRLFCNVPTLIRISKFAWLNKMRRKK